MDDNYFLEAVKEIFDNNPKIVARDIGFFSGISYFSTLKNELQKHYSTVI